MWYIEVSDTTRRDLKLKDNYIHVILPEDRGNHITTEDDVIITTENFEFLITESL